MKYSIVIPTFNNAPILERCIGSILRSQDITKGEYEIIVVQNGAKESPESVATTVFLDSLKVYFKEQVEIIRFEENEGFCVATNAGMRAAKGDFIVWLNDDTVVSPNWLDTLSSTLTKPTVYCSKPGLVGPISNNVGGMQKIDALAKALPEETFQIQMGINKSLEIERQNTPMDAIRTHVLNSNFLSGFCIMMTREAYTTIGEIDEIYSPGGFCDNDYAHRAILAGFGVLVDRSVYIYHQGSVTLDREYPNLYRGVGNWDIFVKKWQTPKPKKLLLLQRIKIDDEVNLNMYKMCSERNKPLVDGVIILSDRSDLLDYSTIKEIWGDKLVAFYANAKDQEFNEFRDKHVLMIESYKNKDKFDWCVYMDHDEAFDKAATPKRLQQLMSPMNPTYYGYAFLYNNFWRSYDLARVDGYWGNTVLIKMWRNIFEPRLQNILPLNPTGIHAPTIPVSVPQSNGVQLCNITIDHYGYAEPRSAEKKKAFYEKMDKSSLEYRKIAVHPSGTYNHLSEVGEMTLIHPEPFNISLNMLCKNEKAHVWGAIQMYSALVDEFVIIDTGSTDGTPEALKSVGMPVLEMDLDRNFSKARNKCIEMSTGKYCMHIDPDEIPEPDYAKKIVKMLIRSPEIAIWHFNNIQKDGRAALTRQPRIFLRRPDIYYNGRVHEVLEKSLSLLDHGPVIQDLDLVSINPGFLKEDKDIDGKLSFYAELLHLEIEDDPENAKAFFELSLHYKNMNDDEKTLKYLGKALELSPKYILALREMSLFHVNKAYRYIKETENLPSDPGTIQTLQEIEKLLRPIFDAQMVIGTKSSVEQGIMV